AKKPGSAVSVRLGSSEVTINGETRPLDVPPMLYQGVVMVPVRVISEALGAYVLWVANRRLVVIRYIPPVPPAPAPTAEPTAAPIVATPIPAATLAPLPEKDYRGFIAVAKAASQNYNEFSAGQWCPYNTYVASAAYMFKNSPFAIKGDYRGDGFVSSINAQNAFGAYFTQFATIDGGYASTPVFLGKQSTLDGRLEYKLADPNIYVGLGYLQTSTSYGYPHLRSIGVGLEKLPDLNRRLTAFGSVFFYPNASGDYTVANAASPNNSKTYRQVYAITKYDIGLAYSLKNFPIYIYGGFSGDRYAKRQNAPIDQTHGGPYLGLGLKI
ncbi:MAG: copper amine oxidase N-terminal domain-containing protein, partial [Candidatus Eremiobacteraeota bacterium]|nr:copper amine oxidase N-terminal domain-containing protein [Candidatus Eremiobacteraeota bacterium]